MSAHFELQHQIHPLLAEGVDVIEDESDDDVNPIAFMGGDAVLWNQRDEQKNRRDTSITQTP